MSVRRRLDSSMRIRIEGFDLPGNSCGPSANSPGGHHNIHVGLQRRNKRDELLGLAPADASSACWTIDCEVRSGAAGADIRGQYIQGPPGARFIYLNWGTVDQAGTFTMFRRAKVYLDGVPPAVLDEADRTGMLIGRLGLTDSKGNPTCASVRPPLIEWSAG
jgi:Family of unknown function (DUF5990)